MNQINPIFPPLNVSVLTNAEKCRKQRVILWNDSDQTTACNLRIEWVWRILRIKCKKRYFYWNWRKYYSNKMAQASWVYSKMSIRLGHFAFAPLSVKVSFKQGKHKHFFKTQVWPWCAQLVTTWSQAGVEARTDTGDYGDTRRVSVQFFQILR